VAFLHEVDKVLESVCVRLSGNDAVHFNEVRVEFGFGGTTTSECLLLSSNLSLTTGLRFLSDTSVTEKVLVVPVGAERLD
jgi:hypothetical protein